MTDWLDGFLARRLSLETPFGAFFDPVADKLMVRTSRGGAAAAGARRGRRWCAALTSSTLSTKSCVDRALNFE